jgi:hypothetical protein
VAAIGYTEVEMLRSGLETLTPLAKDAGLAVPAMHVEAPVVTGDWTAWKALPGASSLLPAESYGVDAASEVQEQRVEPTAFAEVGSGVLDFRAVLAAAREVGVAHAFVEQDHTPGDPLESLKKSYAHLASLRS